MKLICVLMMLLSCSVMAANKLVVSVCQVDKYNCFSYILENVKSYKWINDNKVLRISYTYGAELDLNLGGMRVEVKKW